jgi:hypothetical protein
MANSYLRGENRGSKSKYLNGSASLLVAQAPIEVECEGGWSREELLRMDTAFCAALERAIASGLERRASACAEFAGVRTGSAVSACYRAAALARSASGVPWGGMSSLALV